ncbi:hypothetical protein Mapa_016317 [Marchantia paleacea]|nr:hypothetical protein Mapa_016317 [Marchantia paleacea]
MTAWLQTTFLEDLTLDIEAGMQWMHLCREEWRHLLKSLRTNTRLEKLTVPPDILDGAISHQLDSKNCRFTT